MAWREALKVPIAKPTAPKPKFDTKDDDWETDVNYEVKPCASRLNEPDRLLCPLVRRMRRQKNRNALVQRVYLAPAEWIMWISNPFRRKSKLPISP